MLTASWEPSQIVPVRPAIPYTVSSTCPSYYDLVKMLAFYTLLPGPRWGQLGNLPEVPLPRVQPATGSAHAVLTCCVTLGLASLCWSLHVSSVILFTCNPGASSLVP